MKEDLEQVTRIESEKIPPQEDAAAFKRLLEGLYGRQDLQDLSEGRLVDPHHYDADGKYVGPSKDAKDVPVDEIPF